MSMYNDIDWSKGEENFKKTVLPTPRKSEMTHTDSRRDIGLFSVQEMNKMEKNAHVQARRSLEPSRRDDDAQFQRKRSSRFPSNQSVGSRILEIERWTIIDSLQR